MTFDDIANVAREAGFGEADIATAAAVAMAESGGRPNANGPSDGNRRRDTNSRYSVGLWQMNLTIGPPPGDAWGLYADKPEFSPAELEIPRNNATAALRLFLSPWGNGWESWGAYRNRSYLKFLPTKEVAVKIVPRKDWKARAPLSRHTIKPNRDIFIHHTAGPPSQTPRQIQNFHMDTRRWSDIAYSFLIHQDGTVYEGRGWQVSGAHTAGHNSTSHAICLIGNYHAGDRPTAVQRRSARELIALGIEKGHVLKNPLIRPHRAVASTACPGHSVVAIMDQFIPKKEELNPAPAPPQMGPVTQGLYLISGERRLALTHSLSLAPVGTAPDQRWKLQNFGDTAHTRFLTEDETRALSVEGGNAVLVPAVPVDETHRWRVEPVPVSRGLAVSVNLVHESGGHLMADGRVFPADEPENWVVVI